MRRGVDEHRLPSRLARGINEAGVRNGKSQGNRRGVCKVHAA